MSEFPFNFAPFKSWLAILGLIGAGFHFLWGWLVPYLAERRQRKARVQAERAFR